MKLQGCREVFRIRACIVCRDAKVMDQALALHDACLRSVLHNHYGYEASQS